MILMHHGTMRVFFLVVLSFSSILKGEIDDFKQLNSYKLTDAPMVLMGRRCSAVNYVLTDKKYQKIGSFFETFSHGASTVEILDSGGYFDEEFIIQENTKMIDKYYQKYADMIFAWIKKNNIDMTKGDPKTRFPEFYLNDLDYCSKYFAYVQEQIELSPYDFENLKELIKE
tara:strand:- start:240 stop:752 length:513 start_codon:yes stop_codon:yes gene_type:complete